MTTLMIIGDGMSDLPLPELGGRTPLEVADCKNMAKICFKGRSGRLEPLGPNTAAESEAAIMTILGYPHLSTKISRGPLEALGAGLTLEDNDLAFRCNFALVDENLRILRERVNSAGPNSSEFAESLQSYCSHHWGIDLHLKQTWRFKGVLVLRGDNLSPQVSTPPPMRGEAASRSYPLGDTPHAKRTSMIINAIIRESNRILSRSFSGATAASDGSTNIMIPWGVGRKPSPEPFHSKYGLRAACVAGSALVRGIGETLGMTVASVPGATGGVDTDVEAKAEAALELCKDHSFVLLHVGGPDEASHDGEVSSKVLIIKKIDSMLGQFLENVDLETTLITLLADHTSSTALRRHTSHPTPIVIAGGQTKPDNVREYSERAAAKGGLGRVSGARLMQTVLGRQS